MKVIFTACFILLSSIISAQIKSALVGIDGLTCSACSYATEKSLRKLDFVKDVESSLNENVARIIFVEGKNIDLEAVAKKVKEAGYSVRNIYLIVSFPQQQSEKCYTVGNLNLYLINGAFAKSKDDVKVKVIGKNFMSRKAYKEFEKKVVIKCPAAGNQKQYEISL